MTRETMMILGRWASDAIENYLAGMTKIIVMDAEPKVGRHRAMQRTEQLVLKMEELVQKLESNLGPQQESECVVGRANAESTHCTGPVLPSVLVVSRPPKQIHRGKVHLAPPPTGPRAHWKTFGCNFRYGLSDHAQYPITDLPKIWAEPCRDCFSRPYWNGS